MPYRDPEQQRTYNREYKRRQRAAAPRSIPGQSPMRKAYICPGAPNLRLPGITFKGGLYITNRPIEQAIIEPDPLYGGDIFSWRMEP